MESFGNILDSLNWPFRTDFLSLPLSVTLFALVALPILWMGLPALRWMGTARQAVAIGLRLAALWMVIMVLAGLRWDRAHRNVEVMVLRDGSASTINVPHPPGITLQGQIDQFIQATTAFPHPPADKIGVVRFSREPLVDSLPASDFRPGAGAIQDPAGGTDIASAIQLGLACFSGDAMKRLVLVSDGNATQGDTESALAAATAARVPIDVLPLEYEVDREVIIDRLIAPGVVREGDAVSIEAVVRSTNSTPVWGNLTITHQGLPIDVNPQEPGIQTSVRMQVKPGSTPVRLKLPPLPGSGVHDFKAVFAAESPADDVLTANNSAEAFTYVKGKSRLLYVDGVADGEGIHLARALAAADIGEIDVQRITPEQFPTRLIDLQSYDAIVLANVPHGADGLDNSQDRLLTTYVHDMGGGLVVLGGPEGLGAGGWQGSKLEQVLPVALDVPARRVLHAGALVLVLDHSGSMREPMPKNPGVIKQETANESAVLAVYALTKEDLLGVVAFDGAPTWVVDLARNRDPLWAAAQIRAVRPAGGTAIGPALDAAVSALERIGSDQAGIRRILLLTDGRSQGYDYDKVLKRAAAAKVVVSTIAIGQDPDITLLQSLAKQGGGRSFVVDDPHALKQIFVREARVLRRSLIQEPDGGIGVSMHPESAPLFPGFGSGEFPRLNGIVLTSRLSDPKATIILSANNADRDPILAHRQAGLGRTVVFAGDATRRWAPQWIGSGNFTGFWSQVIRSVVRAPLSNDFELNVTRDGDRLKLVVDATDASGGSRNFLRFQGRVVGSNGDAQVARLVQTGPGRYEATVEITQPGSHIAMVKYDAPSGEQGTLIAGTTVAASPELRDLQSNNRLMRDIALRTGGRIHSSFDPAQARLFAREGLSRSSSQLPVWDYLLYALLPMVLLDVAARRIAWDSLEPRRALAAVATRIRSYTTTRRIESQPTLAALKQVREELGRTMQPVDRQDPPSAPDPKARFESGGIEGDITEVVGGAIDRPIPAPPKTIEPKGIVPGDTGSHLLKAKRRAQQQIREQNQG